MPKSRAHKEAMGLCGEVKKGGVSDSGKGPANVHAKNKQYVTPKKVYTGPNYPQDEPMPGVTQTTVMK